jgi:hypothetical protein
MLQYIKRENTKHRFIAQCVVCSECQPSNCSRNHSSCVSLYCCHYKTIAHVHITSNKNVRGLLSYGLQRNIKCFYVDIRVSGEIIPATLPFTVSMVQESSGVSRVLLDGSRGEGNDSAARTSFFFFQ